MHTRIITITAGWHRAAGCAFSPTKLTLNVTLKPAYRSIESKDCGLEAGCGLKEQSGPDLRHRDYNHAWVDTWVTSESREESSGQTSTKCGTDFGWPVSHRLGHNTVACLQQKSLGVEERMGNGIKEDWQQILKTDTMEVTILDIFILRCDKLHWLV